MDTFPTPAKNSTVLSREVSQTDHAFARDNRDHRGESYTFGSTRVTTKYSDGTEVLIGGELIYAKRGDELLGQQAATQIMVAQGKTRVVDQLGYSYQPRQLPHVHLLDDTALPDGDGEFEQTPVTWFGKGDTEDEGFGDGAFMLVQTNSDLFGASVKRSRLMRLFGKDYPHNIRRLTAIVEVYNPQSRRLARLPLVDVGPQEMENGKHYPVELDLTRAAYVYLQGAGNDIGNVKFRVLSAE